MNTNYIDDELLDLVSDDDTVIGTELRSIIYANNLHWMRGVCALIINSKGQIWIPRRHPNKKILPLHLDMSVSGHVGAGETYEQALFRETQEEVRMDLAQTPWEKILYLTPAKHGALAFVSVYAIHSDEEPNYNTDDFVSAEWLSPAALTALIEQGEKTKHTLPLILKNLPKSFSSKNH